MNSFSLAASKKQLLSTDTGATQEPQKPGFVSEPNFEEDISISVEEEEPEQPTDIVEEVKAISKSPAKVATKPQVNPPAISNAALIGNVAKLKNSKLYQKFMQKKDIVPQPVQSHP